MWKYCIKHLSNVLEKDRLVLAKEQKLKLFISLNPLPLYSGRYSGVVVPPTVSNESTHPITLTNSTISNEYTHMITLTNSTISNDSTHLITRTTSTISNESTHLITLTSSWKAWSTFIRILAEASIYVTLSCLASCWPSSWVT